VLQSAVAGEPGALRPLRVADAGTPGGMVRPGHEGIAMTALFPSGQIEVAGRRYEAKLAVGFADAGTPVTVIGIGEFGLIVEVKS